MATCAVDAAVEADRRPNILVIVAGDLGYSDLGFQDGADIPTPSLDTLAASGVVARMCPVGTLRCVQQDELVWFLLHSTPSLACQCSDDRPIRRVVSDRFDQHTDNVSVAFGAD